MDEALDGFRAAGRWFPPERGPVLVIGNAGSLFTRRLVSLWKSIGIDARLATRRWNGDRIVDDSIPVLVATDTESRRRKIAYDLLERGIEKIESRVISWQRQRYATAMG